MSRRIILRNNRSTKLVLVHLLNNLLLPIPLHAKDNIDR